MIPRYRAWDKEFKEMVQVDALVFEEQLIKATYKNGNVVKEDLKNYVLMQSTGLTDKNGKEIFEGDILSIETDEENVKVKIEVSWDSKHALFVFESKKYNEKEALGELFEDNPYPFKIIGNVWEDPELAEVSS
nr:MAG: YopX protein [Bacteriophage sp.]